MEISEVRKRLRHTIEQTRQDAAARRSRMAAAGQAYESFLARVATPVFQMFATALKAEGHPFKVFTPAGAVRLMSDHSAEDFIELTLDTSAGDPVVSGHVSRERGRRILTAEAPLREKAPIDQLTEEDVLEFLLREIRPFVER